MVINHSPSDRERGRKEGHTTGHPKQTSERKYRERRERTERREKQK